MIAYLNVDAIDMNDRCHPPRSSPPSPLRGTPPTVGPPGLLGESRIAPWGETPPYTRQRVTQILALDQIEVRIGNVPVVSSASCTVESGQCLGIQGPNGSGKTTLLRVMATLLRPSSGQGSILGAALDTAGFESVRPRIGLSGHLPALSDHLTLRENLAFVARITGQSSQGVEQVLETVGLAAAADRLAADCSHGMRKRADLARLFLTRPDLLLLDEPHAGLDSSATRLVAALVRHTTDKGGGAVIVSHDPTTMVDLADQHMTLRTGILSQ